MLAVSNLATDAAARRNGEACRCEWLTHLPPEWRQVVVAPLDFELHREYEADAARAIGRDEDGVPCFTAHHFVFEEARSDDDDDFYHVVAYAESLSAWRLRDGRWLIYRVIVYEGEVERGRSFYSFSDAMPC